jgi:hypothetical protein
MKIVQNDASDVSRVTTLTITTWYSHLYSFPLSLQLSKERCYTRHKFHGHVFFSPLTLQNNKPETLYMNHPNFLRRAESFFRKLTVPQRARNSPAFCRARRSITSTGSYCEPGQSSPRALILFLGYILML